MPLGAGPGAACFYVGWHSGWFSKHWSGRVVRRKAWHLQRAFQDRHLATVFGPLHFLFCVVGITAPILQTRKLKLQRLRDFLQVPVCEWHSQESNLCWSASQAEVPPVTPLCLLPPLGRKNLAYPGEVHRDATGLHLFQPARQRHPRIL